MQKENDAVYAAVESALDTCTPDMLWVKDLDGVYLYANSKLAYGLYRTSIEGVVGKTDLELAKHCKEVYGDTNFTFGEMCSDSDSVVVASNAQRVFVEEGVVAGSFLSLEVNKRPALDRAGKIFGTVGVGRDVTSKRSRILEVMEDAIPAIAERIDAIANENYYPNKDKGCAL